MITVVAAVTVTGAMLVPVVICIVTLVPGVVVVKLFAGGNFVLRRKCSTLRVLLLAW